MRLVNKFYFGIIGLTMLAAVSSVVLMLAIWRMKTLVGEVIADELPSVRVAAKLQNGLLRQYESVVAYVFRGTDRDGRSEQTRRKQNVDSWFAEARALVPTADEQTALARLESVYRTYEAKSEEVIALCNDGQRQRAEQVLLAEVNPLRDQASRCCEDFIAANERQIAAATARVESRSTQLFWLAGGCVGLTIVFGAGLMWLFVHGIHRPLRQMAAEAQSCAETAAATHLTRVGDEFHAVGFYLRTLMTDVTDARCALQRSRQQLHSAEKLASVGKLAASVAHEIRNPLIAVKMWLTSLRQKPHRDADLGHGLELIAGEINRLEGIVRDFLEFARPAALTVEPQPLGPLLDETLDLLGERLQQGHIRVVRGGDRRLSPVLVDRKQIKQLMLNLLNNAVEAMPQGGEIRVTAEATRDADVRPMVVVRIADSGGGVPTDVQQRLFEPFFTTKEGGTGLGLCIAAGIMNRHGGRLVLESSSDAGTCFAVWIPAAACDVAPQSNEAADRSAAPRDDAAPLRKTA